MPSLTGPQCKQLVDIIVKCFDEGSLERMLFFHLEVHLNTIAGNGPFEEVTFKVVNWSEAQGRTPELLTALKEERPQKTELVEVVTKLRAAGGYCPPQATRFIIRRSHSQIQGVHQCRMGKTLGGKRNTPRIQTFVVSFSSASLFSGWWSAGRKLVGMPSSMRPNPR